jgi:hypothetical protein
MLSLMFPSTILCHHDPERIALYRQAIIQNELGYRVMPCLTDALADTSYAKLVFLGLITAGESNLIANFTTQYTCPRLIVEIPPSIFTLPDLLSMRAHGYLIPTSPVHEIGQAIHKVSRGGHYLSPELIVIPPPAKFARQPNQSRAGSPRFDWYGYAKYGHFR